MSDIIKVVVDAMGGDNAPEAPIKGAVDAVNENEKINVVLVGRTDDIKSELAKYTYDKERITIVHAEDIIGFDEPPVMAIRKKKQYEPCKTWRSGCFRISRKYRCNTCWWSVCCG